MKRIISILIALVMLLSFSLIGFGDIIFEKIQVDLVHDMKFQLDGKMWQPKDLDGSSLSPLIYKGRSYVPVRALLEENNFKVDYDDKTRTIILENPLFNAPPVAQSSPLFIQKSEIGGPYKEWPNYDILFGKAFDSDGLGFTNTIEMDLAEDAILLINGKETSPKEAINIGSISGGGGAGKAIFRLKGDTEGQVRLAIDSETKLIKALVMDGEPISDIDITARKVSVDITISGPPWKIVIRIRF